MIFVLNKPGRPRPLAAMVALCRRSVVKRLGAVWAGLMVGLLLASGAQAQQLAWTEMGGAAVDIGVGADGTVWVTNAGGSIYRWTNGAWNNVPGAAVRVSEAESFSPAHQIGEYLTENWS